MQEILLMTQSSLIWTYVLMTVIPAVLFLFSTLFGGDADVDVDVDLDVDVGIEAGGPGLFSLKLILLFIVGFGVAGYFSLRQGRWPVLHETYHALVGIGGGVVAWLLGYFVLRFFHKQQSNSQVRAGSLVGKQAKVTTPIRLDGTGEINCFGTILIARATDSGRAYGRGETVTIRAVAGGTATVE
jgi:membrane protein implicated in regulation of membrane protease activity